MRIAIAGSTGLIGTALVDYLAPFGHEIHRLMRRGSKEEDTDILWDPAHGGIPPSDLEGFDAVVCLSGAGIADARWTPQRKEVLRSSRLDTVGLLAKTLASRADPPECLVCASAIGYYGADRGKEVLTEESAPGDDFVARLCLDWEAAAEPAVAAGIRVVHLRFGTVMSPKGGALEQMLTPFKFGLGGILGSGRQYMSWVSLDDAVGIIDFAIQNDELVGPINALAPNPTTNREFTKALGKALGRPTLARIPKFVLRAALGELSDLLLGSVRAFPRKLESAGYRFRHPDIGGALDDLVGD